MSEALAKLLEGFPISIVLPVQWGEQDAFRHVNNVVYFRWIESARIHYGNEAGMARLMAERNTGPILAAVACHYRRQLTFPDTVHIGARISRIGRTSMVMEHRIVSEKHAVVAAEADSTIVVFDYTTHKPVPVPPEIRAAIEKIEGRPFD